MYRYQKQKDRSKYPVLSERAKNTLRPKKINVEFPLTLPKKLGPVGR